MPSPVPVRPLLLGLALLAAPLPAVAEHEHDHRYQIEGYVLDAEKRPLSGVAVYASVRGGPQEGALTGDDGFYEMRLHLHDSDIGKAIRVRAGEQTATVRMQAEAGNVSDKRVHHVNFIGGVVSEQALSGGRLPGWAYGAAGAAALLALGAAVVWAERRRKRRLRAQKAAERAPNRPRRRRGKG